MFFFFFFAKRTNAKRHSLLSLNFSPFRNEKFRREGVSLEFNVGNGYPETGKETGGGGGKSGSEWMAMLSGDHKSSLGTVSISRPGESHVYLFNFLGEVMSLAPPSSTLTTHSPHS